MISAGSTTHTVIQHDAEKLTTPLLEFATEGDLLLWPSRSCSAEHASKTGLHSFFISLEPFNVAGFGNIAGGDENPVAELFLGHVAETAGEVLEFVAAGAEGGELVVGALVVGEGDTSWGEVIFDC